MPTEAPNPAPNPARNPGASRPRAVVVGCGVSGLSCGVRLLESGFAVEVWTREMPPRTTSSVAGAIWYPFQAFPAERVARWAKASFEEYARLARDPSSGVTMRSGIEVLPAGAVDENAASRRLVPRARPLGASELPDGFDRGFEVEVPVIEMPVYLEHLSKRFLALGGRVRERAVESFDEGFAEGRLVVNCAGLASRELASDREMFAIRGQLVRVERRGVERHLLDDFDPRGLTYVIPRSRDCVLGGTVEVGREDLVPDEAATQAILQRCRSLEPRLAEARVLSVAVGLRPGRSSVRVERVELGHGRTLIHDYGHGGAGVTLAWGCAEEVRDLAAAAV
jgi:D-amino-acid oxidase